MPPFGISVVVKVNGLRRFAKNLAQPTSEPIRKMYIHWAERVRGFLQLRFVAQSRGAGEWPDLADKTKQARRGPSRQNKKKGKPRRFAILRNLGVLFGVLDPVFADKPGTIQEDLPNGIRIGFGGPAQHPPEPGEKAGFATIADIAGFHQIGNRHLPQRRIIVPPDAHTIQGMVSDGNKAMKDLTDDANQ